MALGMGTPEVVRLTGVSASTLDNWANRGLCSPSLVNSSGRRATRYWSVADVVAVRTIKALRGVGCPLDMLRRAAGVLQSEWDSTLSDAVLWWDGRDVLVLTPAGDVVSLIKRQGQTVIKATVMQSVSCPVGTWERQIASLLAGRAPIPVAEINGRHSRRLAERAASVDWETATAAAKRS